MAKVRTRIIIIRADGHADFYLKGTVDVDSPASAVIQDIKDVLQLSGDYELYIKVSPRTHLNAMQMERIETIAMLPVDVMPSRSVDLR